MAFIELLNINKSYCSGETVRHILKNVNLSVEAGEFVSVVGFTGAGKSTLLNIAAGLLPADGGQVQIAGERVGDFSRRAAMVFQNYSLLPWFSALENVRLAVEGAYPSWPKSRQELQAVRFLERVGLRHALHKRPSQLSGGMRQRVAIARAFAVEPRLLFLDEPFGALDALTRSHLQQELSRLCAETGQGVTTLMITNSVDEAILLSDRIVPLSRAPRASLGPSIAVPLDKPRSADALMHDAAALQIRSRVVESLTGFVESAGPVRRAPKLPETTAAQTAFAVTRPVPVENEP